ncbi:shikimate kinase [Flavihumibacter stibioxidans]|uniref:Shikimate kinase n=1 Tax=Flavihumibacter stibioxidans TaxID=1834163 RepID=A0ABR7MBZ6_9BACT|nr:shikimate kinase [Flavihumibacter stibioxidans]MBC6492560.1 shikimate kinase [Flavihumibacter stibioxidans]
MRVYLIGFMGSGKSFWGRKLSAAMKVPFFDLDDEIVQREQKPITEIFSEKGEEYFRRLEKDILEQLTETNEDMILSCGGGTPCFFGNIDYMKGRGKVVWLNTSTNVLVERLLKEKTHRPLLRDIPDEDMKAFIVRKLHDRKLYYEQAHLILKEETLSSEQLQQAIENG